MDGMAENSAEIEKFVQESQDCNFLQEDAGSENNVANANASADNASDAMS